MSNVNPNINEPGGGAGAPNANANTANASNSGANASGQQTYHSAGRADDQRPYGQPYAYYEPYGRPDMGRGAGYGPDGTPGAGDWQPMDPFRLIEELLPQRAKNAVRMLYGVIGVAAVLLGAALLFWPGKTLAVAAVALGIYFVIAGVIRIVGALATLGLPSGWRVLDVMVGFLLTVGGIVMLKNAVISGQSLALFVTMIVGIGWIMEGVMALAESWAMPSSGWAVLYAVLSIVAGVTLLFAPMGSAVFLMIFAGVVLIVMGACSLVRAFTFGRSRSR